MKVRYVLAPEAAADLAQIWRYIKKRLRRWSITKCPQICFIKRI